MSGALLLLSVPSGASGLVAQFREDHDGQGTAAVTLARQAVAYACRTHEMLPLPATLPPLLRRPGAVFVSAMTCGTGAPRFCMGTLQPRQPTLAQEIIANAFAAVTCDKRFHPLKPAELAKIRVIVSIIGEQSPIDDPAALDPLTDGLAVRGPQETGVVLPGETANPATMLAWGRTRAGLRRDDPATCLCVQAIRFMEESATK